MNDEPFDQVAEPLIVERSECSDKVWALLEHRTARVQQLQRETDQLQQRLCRYEGHLPIHDHDGQPWCELCGAKLTLTPNTVKPTPPAGKVRREGEIPARWSPAHAPQPVAMVKRMGATLQLEWASVEAAHNAKPGPLYASGPDNAELSGKP